MAFTAPRTWVYGETVTEAQLNEQIRDNENAMWVGTTAGDMDFYTSSTTKTRVGIGGVGYQMSSDGSVPVWIAGGMSLLAGTVLAGSIVPGGTLDFTGLSQNFTHLHCMINTLVSGTASAIGVYLNGDTGANYAYRNEYFQSGLTASYSLNSNELLYGQALTSFYSSYPASLEIDIFNYSGSVLWKTAVAKNLSINGNSTTLFASKRIYSFWRNTNPVTSIQFVISPLWSVGTIMPGSSFQIYGLK